MNGLKIRLLISILLLFAFTSSYAAQANPREWFETQYTDAQNKITNSKTLIYKQLAKTKIGSKAAISIVFPEMLRYTLWKDIFETSALETLYTEKGSSLADFSIGWFQMKPSFAEKIESRILKNEILLTNYKALTQFKSTQSISIRKERVDRLKSFHWQLLYLAAFTDIMYTKLGNLGLSKRELLKLMAAAYNKGIDSPIKDLEKFQYSKTFPYGPGQENPFGYVELALYFYDNDVNKVLN